MWGTLNSILESQYVLARKLHVSPLESNLMPDFEREIFINLFIKECEEEKKALNSSSTT